MGLKGAVMPYLSLTLEINAEGRVIPTEDSDEYGLSWVPRTKALNALGAKGWYIVGVVPNSSVTIQQGAKSTTTYVTNYTLQLDISDDDATLAEMKLAQGSHLDPEMVRTRLTDRS